MTYRNSEPEAEVGTAVQTWTPEVGTRLGVVIQDVGGPGKAASLVGVTPHQISRWRDGKARAPFMALAVLAKLAGRSLDWLAHGVEPSPAAALQRNFHIESELMARIVDVIINIHRKDEIVILPQDIARLASEKYIFLWEMSGVMIQQFERMFGRDELVIYLDGLVNIIAAQLRESLKEAARPPVKRSA